MGPSLLRPGFQGSCLRLLLWLLRSLSLTLSLSLSLSLFFPCARWRQHRCLLYRWNITHRRLQTSASLTSPKPARWSVRRFSRASLRWHVSAHEWLIGRLMLMKWKGQEMDTDMIFPYLSKHMSPVHRGESIDQRSPTSPEARCGGVRSAECSDNCWSCHRRIVAFCY